VPPRRRQALKPTPYNPLDERNLGRAIREEMERQPVHPVPPDRFMGAGLYALYYVGRLVIYDGINDRECITPIYVGKAEAGTSSYGTFVEGTETTNLYDRIRAHMNSIRQAPENLSVDDFRVRYLVTSDVHIVLGEAGLLQAFAPVLWNTVVTGFGINAPGAGRGLQRKSRWDTLHPGRARASGRPDNELSVEELTQMVRRAIAARLSGEPAPADVLAEHPDLDEGIGDDEVSTRDSP
jgi:hypothetical protein